MSASVEGSAGALTSGSSPALVGFLSLLPLEGEVPSLRGDGGVRANSLSLYPIDLGQSPEATSPARGRKKVGSFLTEAASSLCLPLEGEVPSLRGDGGVVARARLSTPSTSAKTPRPLPLQGEGKNPARRLSAGTPRGSRSAASGTPPSGSSPALLGRFRLRGKGRRAAECYVNGRQNVTLTSGRMLT